MERTIRAMIFLLGIVLVGGLINILVKDKLKETFINRAEIANALSVASVIKTQVEAYYFDNGELPYSNYSLGLPEPESFRSQGLKEVVVEDLGVIHLVLGDQDASRDGHIFLIPQELSTQLSDRWLCLTPSYKTIREFAPQCKYQPVEGW